MSADELDMNVAMDNDGSESRVDDTENGAAKTGVGSSSSSSASSCVFRAIPPFLQKLFEMLGNEEFSPVVSWSCAGTSFVIKDPHSFAADVLPLYYKHNNIQSFTTQLHSYGFKKVSWAQCEYKNEYFRKGRRNLLKNIRRRDHYSKISQPSSNTKASVITTSSCSVEMANSNTLTDLKTKHDHTKAEITKVKEKQQNLDERIASLKRRTISVDEDQERLMIVAKKILEKEKVPSNAELPMLETEQRKGKRKFEVQLDTTGDTEEKRMSGEEEEMTMHLPDTFFSLEELYGGPMDWVQYIKELQENACYNLKSPTEEST